MGMIRWKMDHRNNKHGAIEVLDDTDNFHPLEINWSVKIIPAVLFPFKNCSTTSSFWATVKLINKVFVSKIDK